jgi:glycosyltransferase involved in cell wall biosynthesis
MKSSKLIINSLTRLLQEKIWSATPDIIKSRILWPISRPSDSWDSFDRQPWNHPWLSVKNIKNFRIYSDICLEKVLKSFEESNCEPKNYGFVGNMANNLYMRACVLSKRNLSISTFLHPFDQTIMGQPFWEEFDGDLPSGASTIQDVSSISFPIIEEVFSYEVISYPNVKTTDLLWPMRFMDLKRFHDFFSYFKTLVALQKYDALLAVQTPYLAYLSGKPYAVTQMGGDIWFECSRDDQLGRLQRKSFSSASIFIISNPWSLAFARRYNFSNMVYLPFLLDEVKYSPGKAVFRDQWIAEVGGDFFVMMTSRIDYSFKGSWIAVKAFARFAEKVPSARLLISDWGADEAKLKLLLLELGILGKVLVIPVVGKRKLIKYLRSADCLIDQLILGYFGASALEAMACGLPVIMNLNKRQYDALIPEGCAPVCHAETEDEIFEHLNILYNQVDVKVAVGKRLREWFLETHSNEKWGKYYEAILWATSKKKVPNFNKSPLKSPLDSNENDYHHLELENAPKFPNYF